MKIRKTDLNKRSLIRWKIYFDRSRMYIGYIQFFLIGFVFLQSFKNNAFGDWIFKYAIISIPIALILFVFLSLLLGYMDTKLGFREEELRNLSKSNPIMMEMLESLKENKEKIDTIEENRRQTEI
ncbi:MAG: hypothetical protein P1P88_19560 [Bacteroidales bacterium]|nr:hypothetical protein [Bacteroidales bacterium]